MLADIKWADFLVFVFEANQYLSTKDIRYIKTKFKRNQIIVIDPDGRSCPTVNIDGDSNHLEIDSPIWLDLFDSLSEKILVPKVIDVPIHTIFHPYFGMERFDNALASHKKEYLAQYVGNNWYRWKDIQEFVLAVSKIKRSERNNVVLKGKHWDGSYRKGNEAATKADVDFLRNHEVKTFPSVPFGNVVSSMSQSHFNPIFVRPMIAAQKLITPRMLETLSAHTIPLFSAKNNYIEEVFGKGSEYLAYENLEEKLLEVLNDLDNYYSIVDDLRRQAYKRFNYQTLFSSLVDILLQ